MLPPQQQGYGHYPPPQAYPPPQGYGAPHPMAPPTGPNAAVPPGAGRNVDQLKTELEKLNELRISGLLTEEEFAQQKARLLGQ